MRTPDQQPAQVLTAPTRHVSAEEAQRLAREHYGIAATAERLAGEKDDNYRLDGADGRFVLKIVHAAEPPVITALGTDVLLHLAAVSDLPVHRIVPARDGRPQVDVETAEGERRTLRMTSYVDGRMLHAVPSTRALREGLGELLARLGQALAGFEHPGLHRELLWDIAQADRVTPLLDDLGGLPGHESLVACLAHFEQDVRPRLASLRAQAVHNDLSGDNVVIAPDDERVAGVLDFGDMVTTQLINDVAVAATNQLGEGPDPFAPVIDLVRGYRRVVPLTDGELELLPDLMRVRVALRIIISEWRGARFPENRRYIMRLTSRAWELLRSMPVADAGAVTERIITMSEDPR